MEKVQMVKNVADGEVWNILSIDTKYQILNGLSNLLVEIKCAVAEFSTRVSISMKE